MEAALSILLSQPVFYVSLGLMVFSSVQGFQLC